MLAIKTLSSKDCLIFECKVLLAGSVSYMSIIAYRVFPVKCFSWVLRATGWPISDFSLTMYSIAYLENLVKPNSLNPFKWGKSLGGNVAGFACVLLEPSTICYNLI